MFKERLFISLQRLAWQCLTLLLMFLLLRIYEMLSINLSGKLPAGGIGKELSGLLNDFVFFCIVSSIIAIPFLLFDLINETLGSVFFCIAALFLIILQVSLLQYFFVTLVPLGADFWGYTWNDINTTVSSSGGTNVFTIIPFILSLVLFFVIRGKLVYLEMSPPVLTGFLILIVGPALFGSEIISLQKSDREIDAYLASNKSYYFANSSLSAEKSKSVATLPASFSMSEYPLMHDADTTDPLGVFFNPGQEKANLVFIMVEGLGKTFVGKNAEYGGCTPFIDSLINHSLFWENFLSTTGRTFGVLPSLFGSLPYAENGFMEMGSGMPNHTSLFQILKKQGYYTTYYYGGNANFDNQDIFLEREGIDFIMDEGSFTPAYKKLEANSGGFTWGYSDRDVFKRSLEIIAERKRQPRLDVYMTLNTHEPFNTPNEPEYIARLERMLSLAATDRSKKDEYRTYKKEFAALIYLDDALKYLIAEYKKRADYNNTIFIITGDHRMIPVPHKNKIDRFRVPFIVFSPMLKQAETFMSVSSHADVTPTLLTFLHKNYGLEVPEKVHWMGKGIDFEKSFRNVHSLPFMRNKNELMDYLDGSYFLSGDDLYLIKDNLELEAISNQGILQKMQNDFQRFKKVNEYVCTKNKLYNDSSTVLTVKAEFDFTSEEENLYAGILKQNLDKEQLLLLAREKATEQHRDEARLICKKLLSLSPNYHDARVLLGRSYAWDGQYDKARSCFRETIRRQPQYQDAYQAWIDVERWSDNTKTALELCDKALALFPDEHEFREKKRILKAE